MNRVVHFEVPADDMDRAKTFYKEVFGWEFNDWPMPDGTTYVGVTTTELNEQKQPKEPGAINGGMVMRDAIPSPIIVMNVADCAAAIERVAASGGEKLMDPKDIMGMGLYAYAKDSEGNTIGIWQDLKKQ